jgi:hypothetical protein
VRPDPPHPPRSCPPLAVAVRVQAREATAQGLGLDSAATAEIIEQRGDAPYTEASIMNRPIADNIDCQRCRR